MGGNIGDDESNGAFMETRADCAWNASDGKPLLMSNFELAIKLKN